MISGPWFVYEIVQKYFFFSYTNAEFLFQQRIGDLAAAALKAVHGTEFEVGDIYETICKYEPDFKL